MWRQASNAALFASQRLEIARMAEVSLWPGIPGWMGNMPAIRRRAPLIVHG